MMFSKPLPSLYFRGEKLDTSSIAFAQLRSSRDLLGDREALQLRMAEDGYLYLPGLLDREEVLATRTEVLKRLDRLGHLSPDHPLAEGVAKESTPSILPYLDDLTGNNPLLDKVLYSGPMIEFYEFYLGGPVRHFDYTWMRVKVAGGMAATPPHYDKVYMGRGTPDLYTSWTPLGDVSLVKGGLMILENSHKLEAIKSTYGQMDVDAYCTNNEEADFVHIQGKPADPRWPPRVNDGSYTNDAAGLPKEVRRRWLSAEYQAGDVLVFSQFTMHAGMDNQTNRFRLSTDTRYQLASEPADERWIGETIIGHGPESKKGMIC